MLRTFSIFLLVVGSVSAQETSPLGLLKTEANSASAFPWSYPSARVQQIDRSITGAGPLVVKSMGFRRDSDPFVLQGSAARTVTFSLILSDASLDKSGTTFAKNHGAGATVIFDKTSVKLPDWTGRSPAIPGPVDVLIPLPRGWSYDGRADLLWEIGVQSNTGKDPALSDMNDALFTTGSIEGKGPGCRIAGLEMRTWSTFDNTGVKTGFSWTAGVYDGPGKQAAAVLVGSDPIPPIPLPKPPCYPFGDDSRLYLKSFITLPLGSTDATGSARAQWQLPWQKNLIGLPLLMQGYAADPKMYYGVRLGSYGVVTIPADPRIAETVLRTAESDTAATATRETKGGIVVVLN